MTKEQARQMLEKASKSVQRLNAKLMEVCPRPEEHPVIQVKTVAKRIRQDSKPLLNKLEEEFYSWWTFKHGNHLLKQAIRFRLANGLWYKPDFVSLHSSPILAYEIKGPHAFRGGFENLKMAATQYPKVCWVLWWRANGEWKWQEVLP